jgi:hypothetical protein
MSRPLTAVVLGALLLGPPATAKAQGSASTPAKESGSPINDQGSNYNYRSNITRVAPKVPGLSLEVLEFADRLVLRNHTGATVTVYGYQGEPYARVMADGTVQVNTRSPAYYLNQSFYGDVNVPSSASPTAKPVWTVIDRAGALEWHDHRIHWMSPVPPPQVKDRGKRTKVFDWQVPIRVGARKGAVYGELLWVPEPGTKTPLAAILALVAVVLAGLALVLLVRKRRQRGGPPPSADSIDGPDRPASEAW